MNKNNFLRNKKNLKKSKGTTHGTEKTIQMQHKSGWKNQFQDQI